jgi:hypothetical protein
MPIKHYLSMNVKKFFYEIYLGVYYHALKYESEETAKREARSRLLMIVFSYYISIILQVLVWFIVNRGTFKIPLIGAIVIVFLPIFIIYKVTSYYLPISALDDPIKEKEKNKLVYFRNFIFTGGIISFIGSLYLAYLILN